MTLLRRTAFLTVLLTVLAAPAAQAGPEQASIMMDDDQLLYRSDTVRARTLTTMRSFGVESVRVTVLWKNVALGASLTNAEIAKLKTEKERDNARAQRTRFKPADPRTYPTRNWDRYDNLVKEATALGMRVYFTLTGPGPRYAHRVAPRSQVSNSGTYKPFPTRFRAFAEAVGRRYTGNYRDENGIRRKLPRVSLWSIWNEPNQPGWLSPQWEVRDGQNVPASPALFRKLYFEGVKGLAKAGHTLETDAILLGETAPLGSTSMGPRNGLKPVPFLRELVCVAPDGSQYAGPDAARRDCQDFDRNGPLKATAFAHHPYTKKAAPTIAPAHPDDITMANVGALGTHLDTLSAQSGGKIDAGLQLFLTEYGYESNPPDPRNGIPLMRQAEFNQLGEFLAYNDPRVFAITQFLLRDAEPVRKYPVGSRLYWFTYQSGLYTGGSKARAKPAAYAYALPFVIFPAGEATIGFWGQLRFRPNGGTDVAVIMHRPDGRSPWTQIGEGVPTSFRGFFNATVPAQGPGEYRAVYVDPETLKITHSSLYTKAPA